MSLRSAALATLRAVSFNTIGTAKPAAGQTTRTQIAPRYGMDALLGALNSGGSGNVPVSPGTFAHYREMRSEPTIALGLAASTCPITAAPWSYKVEDGTPDEWLKFVQAECDRLKPSLVRDMTRAIWMGYQAFEKVWEFKDGRYGIERMHALLQDITTAVLDDKGRLVGLKNRDAELDRRAFLWFTHDQEGDDPYGRSRFENIRKTYARLQTSAEKMTQWIAKNAGVIPVLQYPEGSDVDEGQVEDNKVHAAAVLNSLGRSAGIAIPNKLSSWAEDLIKKGVSPKELMAWQLSFVEAKGGAGGEILANTQHLEKLLLRGLLVPERAVTEGQFGTKAEAGEHADIMLLIAAEVYGDICRCINEQLVDDLLVVNFGPDAKGKIKIIPGALTDTEKAFAREFMKLILTNPANIDILLSTLDFDGMMDTAKMPKLREIIDNALLNAPHEPVSPGALSPSGAPGLTPDGPPRPTPPVSPPSRPVAMARRAMRRYAAEVG